jgi:hypothetical protein
MSKNIDALWEKLMKDEPEPDTEITSSMINQQTMDRLLEENND